MEREVEENEGLAQAKDMLAGTMAGILSKTIEYPFDTIKVFYQFRPVDQVPKSTVGYFR